MVPLRAPWYAISCILLIALSGGACERGNACSDTVRRMAAHMTAVEVEVDIFSGMPNPRWTLSEAEAVTFLSKLSELPNGEAKSRSDRLGYRGLNLVVKSAQSAETRIFVHDGVVETSGGPGITFLR